MKGWNLDDVVYLSRKLDLPDAYIMSMFRFLDKLVSDGLVDKTCGVSILCYQYKLDKIKGTQIVKYYFKKSQKIA